MQGFQNIHHLPWQDVSVSNTFQWCQIHSPENQLHKNTPSGGPQSAGKLFRWNQTMHFKHSFLEIKFKSKTIYKILSENQMHRRRSALT